MNSRVFVFHRFHCSNDPLSDVFSFKYGVSNVITWQVHSFEFTGPNQILNLFLYIYIIKYWKIYWSE